MKGLISFSKHLRGAGKVIVCDKTMVPGPGMRVPIIAEIKLYTQHTNGIPTSQKNSSSSTSSSLTELDNQSTPKAIVHQILPQDKHTVNYTARESFIAMRRIKVKGICISGELSKLFYVCC